MFGKSLTLFRLLGFEVKVDWSWLILGTLITWSLAKGLFPNYYKDLPPQMYWWMGIAGALGLFASIVFHELCHSLVARRYDLPMKGITLFIFGGVAEMTEEPKSPKVEFLMAIAGPLSSIFLGLVFHGVKEFGLASNWPVTVNGVMNYLRNINWILAFFNLLPAFPLDGGRVFRAALWGWKGNVRWATRIASMVGTGFGNALIFLGVLSILFGNFIGGLWGFMIGVFLRGASIGSYQQLLMSKTLEGEPVRRFMETAPVTVNPGTTLHDLVEDFVYRYHHKMFPVVDGERLLGCVTTRDVKKVPREQWHVRTVGEVASLCSQENTVNPETDAVKALATMSRTGNSRLLVVDNQRLVGIVTLKDLLKFLSLKVELEGDE